MIQTFRVCWIDQDTGQEMYALADGGGSRETAEEYAEKVLGHKIDKTKTEVWDNPVYGDVITYLDAYPNGKNSLFHRY